MNLLDPILQILGLLLTNAVVIGALEAYLFLILRFFDKPWFYPVSLLVGWAAAAILGWISTPEEQPYASGVLLGFGGIATGLTILGGLWVKGRNRIAIMMLAPAFLVVCLLIIYPFFFQFNISLLNLKLNNIMVFNGVIEPFSEAQKVRFVWLHNFWRVFTESPLQTANFWQLLWRTIMWTVINLVFHVGFGLFLAMLLNREMKGRGIYRMLLIVPWAMPQVVAILAWRGEFHPQFGMINHLLQNFGFTGINWWSDPWPVFISCCIVNIWLGIPFMMIVFLGGLQSIPKSYYEAASIDGASKVSQFFHITLPMLKPVVVPSVTLGTIWTFNNINVIYLMTGQDGGNEHADILISALYKIAFNYYQYSFAAAFAVVIFLILLLFTLLWIRVTRGTESAVA